MTVANKQFDRFVVEKTTDGFSQSIQQGSFDESDLAEGEILIETQYSSLNYKDALAATGHPGVARNFPHVPGIDCVGKVIASNSDSVDVGSYRIVGHAEFGTSQHGGWSQLVKVPSTWTIALPENLSAQSAIKYGTAGFTAAGCVQALLHENLSPEDGEVVVTGATGGVGIFSVILLAKLGFEVVASTGKPEKTEMLKSLGATRVVTRDDVNITQDRPLLSATWAGGVDTVGGNTLGTVLRATKIGGAVAACGVVAGAELPITVYPFILRGVALRGIDSANTSSQNRTLLWNKIADDWSVELPEELYKEVTLTEMDTEVANILAGKIAGRVVLRF